MAAVALIFFVGYVSVGLWCLYEDLRADRDRSKKAATPPTPPDV
jgi:hypothetical protein